MTRPDATLETWKCSDMPTRVPDGADDAKVAFTTRRTLTTVIYHRRRADQFFGFSISSGLKSRSPFRFTCGSVDFSRASDRYGFAVGRDKNLSIRSWKSQLPYIFFFFCNIRTMSIQRTRNSRSQQKGINVQSCGAFSGNDDAKNARSSTYHQDGYIRTTTTSKYEFR